MTDAATIATRLDKLETNMTRLDSIVNAPNPTDVPVDSGTVPSFATFISRWLAATMNVVGLQNIFNLALGPLRDPVTHGAGAALISAATSRALRVTTALDNGIEFADVVLLDNTKGSTATGANRAKVAKFISVYGFQGGGDSYALNLNVTVESAVGSFHAIACEPDVNNANRHYGDTVHGGLVGEDTYCAPFYINGLSWPDGGGAPYRATAIGIVNMNGWASNRGFLFGPPNGVSIGGGTSRGIIEKAIIDDQVDGQTCVRVSGTKSVAGFDTSGATFATGMAYRLGNGQGIAWQDASFADHLILKNDGGNSFFIGEGAANLFHKVSNYPALDNTYVSGNSSNAWSDVATHHLTTVSDAKLKDNIRDLPRVSDIIAAISPKMYTFNVGGYDDVAKTQEADVPVVNVTKTPRRKIVVDNGVARDVGEELIETREPVYDTLPIVDSEGKPTFRFIPAREAKLDRDGNVISPAREEQTVPATHLVPRTERKTITVTEKVARPGKRLHWGFLAQDVKAAFDTLGEDFGGWTKDNNGREALRYQQLIAVLWKGLQEETAARQALETRVAKLEAAKA